MIRFLVVGLLLLFAAACGRKEPTPPPKKDVTAQVRQFCSACHAYPPSKTFPRWAWKEEVERGYLFFNRSSLALTAPPMDDDRLRTSSILSMASLI